MELDLKLDNNLYKSISQGQKFKFLVGENYHGLNHGGTHCNLSSKEGQDPSVQFSDSLSQNK